MKKNERFQMDGIIIADLWSGELRLIGDIHRARILDALMGKLPLTAGELAYRCRLSAPATSAHLGKLVRAGLIAASSQGRFKYYRLADTKTARRLERLLSSLPLSVSTPCPLRLRKARLCYDHLAGKFSLFLLEIFYQRSWLRREGETYAITKKGYSQFRALDIDMEKLAEGKRPLIRPCMDWSERKTHLAGSLAASLTRIFDERRWILRSPNDRSLSLNSETLKDFQDWLGDRNNGLAEFC